MLGPPWRALPRYWWERRKGEVVSETVGEMMKQLGFELWETGGGSLAYSRVVPGGYVLITREDGSTLPASADEPVLLGWYGAEGDNVPVNDVDAFSTLREAAASIGYVPTIGDRVRFKNRSEQHSSDT